MKRVQFFLDSNHDPFFSEYAWRKGLTLSALAKLALYQYEARHPIKGLSAPQTPSMTGNSVGLCCSTVTGQDSGKTGG